MTVLTSRDLSVIVLHRSGEEKVLVPRVHTSNIGRKDWNKSVTATVFTVAAVLWGVTPGKAEPGGGPFG